MKLWNSTRGVGVPSLVEPDFYGLYLKEYKVMNKELGTKVNICLELKKKKIENLKTLVPFFFRQVVINTYLEELSDYSLSSLPLRTLLNSQHLPWKLNFISFTIRLPLV